MNARYARYRECPGCRTPAPAGARQLWSCPGCGGLIGEVTESEVRALVDLNMWAEEPVDPAAIRYFDLLVAGRRRVHGWYDPRTRKVVQIG